MSTSILGEPRRHEVEAKEYLEVLRDNPSRTMPDTPLRMKYLLDILEQRLDNAMGARVMADGAGFWSSTEQEAAWAKRFAQLYDHCQLIATNGPMPTDKLLSPLDRFERFGIG